MTLDDLTENERDAYEERAAIYEFDANMSRREADRKAMQDIEKKRRLV
ncbi:MAG: hypothetical protein A4E65_00652 [Syntrophorhabdus sp. PtaU1.Bin153]|nr:MAG: hypothetical protein A4E65_00652 [Syntrophorhabdus sp. PtaU1.Bin153]